MTGAKTNTLSKDNFGLNLYKARMNKGMTILDLAVEIDKSERIISYYESGIKFPSLETIILICNVLDVNIDDILRK